MTDKSESIEFEWRNRNQYFATITANLIMLGHGCVVGWFSPALPSFLSTETPLITSGPLTDTEVSWIGSITSVGAMCGSLTFGFFTTLFGCKRTMIFLALPTTIFWILVYFGDSYYYILIARYFTGYTGGGIQTTIVLFISEISNNNIRGRLGSLIQVTRNSGILIAYIVGAIVDYRHIPFVFIIIPLVYAVGFSFIPNTPQYYLKKNQIQESLDALKYYKGYKGDTEEEENALKREHERLRSIAREQQKDQSLHISDFTTQRSLKGMMIGIALAYFSQMTGCFTIITYAVYILERTRTTFDPYKSSIALAAMLIIGNLCTTHAADKMGRKTFLIVSLLGCAVGLFALSIYLYLNTNGYDLTTISWVPIVCLAFIVFIASAGVVPLSHVCRVENLPTKIRTVGLSICIFVLNITSFGSTKLFPIILKMYGIHWCMMIFAANCFVGSIFIYFILNETRGKPMDTLKSEQNCKETSNC